MLDRLLAPITRRLVYPSRGTRIPAADTTYALSVGGADLRGWVVNPGRERALVYFGGNGEPLGWLRPELERRLPGHTSYLIAYRGYGASGGRPSQRALTADALALLDHASTLHPDAPVDVLGRSLGSGVAMQVAARRPVGRLALVTPFDSLAATAGDLVPRLPAQRLIADRWDSAAVAADVGADILVVRAGRDEVVRPPRTDALLAVLPPRTQVADFPRAGHSDLSQDPAYWSALEGFLNR
ncbi:alpha/beta hydrolase [Nocardioides sp. URHA0020]|uniref:alpha/beta hydrolase n=1 Tax=Nocardioides sp. URHA0020 TaxID=1380392 RepID=UPI00068521E5|nr:alpha/beta fold hydrolase [Nocardioides sp. URHA0020]